MAVFLQHMKSEWRFLPPPHIMYEVRLCRYKGRSMGMEGHHTGIAPGTCTSRLSPPGYGPEVNPTLYPHPGPQASGGGFTRHTSHAAARWGGWLGVGHNWAGRKLQATAACASPHQCRPRLQPRHPTHTYRVMADNSDILHECC